MYKNKIIYKVNKLFFICHDSIKNLNIVVHLRANSLNLIKQKCF